jgi:hypothetical protein
MSNFETVPLDEWFRDTPNGDVVLCDPFDGVPLCGSHVALEPRTPTQAFMSDFTLGNGYGYWRGRKYDENAPFVGVYFVDPSKPEGLGSYQDFRELASSFDVVAYDATQALRMEDVRRRSSGIGRIAMAGGTESDATFLSALLDSHPNVVDLAPPVDLLTGKPASDTGRGLQAVRDAVIGQGIDQKDPADPDLRYLATDYIYANTVQWHTVMRSGNVAEDMGRRLTAMLVVLPHEQADYMRKLVVSGLPGERIDFRFARPEYDLDHNADTSSYAFALDRGHIPAEALRGTQY